MPRSLPLSGPLSRGLSRGLSGTATGGPVNTVAPVLSNGGTGEIGDTLTVTDGTWTTEGTISDYAYQWRRDGVPFGAADQNTYDLTADDDDAVMTCRVTATDEFNSRRKLSNSLGPYDLVGLPDNSLLYEGDNLTYEGDQITYTAP